jgi:5-formyltetrahydrofolate cyclo-ligase
MPLTKKQFRQKCLKKLQECSKKSRIYEKYSVNKALLREIKRVKAKNILFYYPLESEVDIRKTLYYLRRKKSIFIPFMVDKSFKMVPFRLPLKKKRFGIFEAGNTLRTIKNIDIAVVPVVGVDINLQRVGFGKGMYDRFFDKLQKKPFTIFIQAKLCYTDEKVCDTYDISGDLLITPSKIIQRHKGHIKRK